MKDRPQGSETMGLAGKVALITGAGSGIGRETSLLFAKHGAKIVAADINQAAALETCQLIRQEGGDALSVEVDVSKAAEVEQALNKTIDAFGKIDILYNSAGLPMSSYKLEEVSEDLFDSLFRVNVKGVFLTCKYAVPIFKKQGAGGVIINIASITALQPRPGQNVYAASKGALITLSKALAAELAPFQIRVVCINPTAVDTPMLSGFIGDQDEQETKKLYQQSIPLGRIAQPSDVAYAALYLASDEGSFITGTMLNVDGGRSLI